MPSDVALGLSDILDKVGRYASDADASQLMRAYLYSARAHQGQMRKSGEDYLIHPIAVAGILADLRMDVDTIAVGLLHDTMEDCLSSHGELESEFGIEVADMVDGVTKIGKLEFRTQHEAQAENFRKLVLAMANDVRVILVKLADRLHNMRTMTHMKPAKQRAISQETMEIYAPIANRLGLSSLKMELEDHCLRYLHPEIHLKLEDQLAATADERERYIERATSELEQHLDERGIRADVKGRPKHLTSIWRKMRERDLAFEELFDIHAFRIFVDSLGDCYTALGLIHGRYRHIPERLKDYIANPKSNGYQSLHTAVIGPEGQTIEVQIRTHQMHAVAEVGIAAHWRYKEGHLALSRDDLSKITQLRGIFEAAREVEDPQEFLETVKVDLFAEEVFVFTPQGDVLFFPQSATVLDFAYAIHTKVGDTCTGAMVNGRIRPLHWELRSGDRLEVIRKPDQKPGRGWLEIAKTGRALSKIRRSIREKEREGGKEIGRDLLETELKKRGTSLAKVTRDGSLEQVVQKQGLHNLDQLFVALATGNVTVSKVLDEVAPDANAEPERPGWMNWFTRPKKRSTSPVLINGESDVLVAFAKCCNPLPGEAVMGFITRGRGISVHLAGCPQLMASDEARRLPVEWHQGASGAHTGEVRVVTANTPGMLAEVGGICKSLSINVTRLEAHELDDGRAEFTLAVNVSDVQQLVRLMRNLEKVDGVIRVDRVREVRV